MIYKILLAKEILLKIKLKIGLNKIIPNKKKKLKKVYAFIRIKLSINDNFIKVKKIFLKKKIVSVKKLNII